MCVLCVCVCVRARGCLCVCVCVRARVCDKGGGVIKELVPPWAMKAAVLVCVWIYKSTN